jgi:copper homeostasis protein
MPRLLLEVIVQTLSDAVEAARSGADRLEVVRDIRLGGLTPPLGLVRAIRAETALPLRVMVRENDGYETDTTELASLRATTTDLAALGVDGIVMGFSRDGEPELDAVARVLQAAPDVKMTFHHAFDLLADPLSAIDRLADVQQIDRILTSGGDGEALLRCERLHRYAVRAGSRVEIVAGGGVDEKSLTLFAQTGCVREVHVGRAAREGNDPEAPVSAARVKRLRALAG